MTCIIGAMTDDQVVFVADSQRTHSEYYREPETAKKLFVIDDRIFGFSGSCPAIDAIVAWMIERGPIPIKRLGLELPNAVSHLREDERDALAVAYGDGALWEISSRGTAFKVDTPYHSNTPMACAALDALSGWGMPIDDMLTRTMEIVANRCVAVDTRLQWERLKR